MVAKRTKKTPVKGLNSKPSQVTEDLSWRARDDARSLQTAAEVMADRTRLKAAQKELKKTQDLVNVALRQVANPKVKVEKTP